jgi:uncharacterized protein (TIGR03435 family)
MESLAAGLSSRPDVQRVVRNLTGLDGRYEITLEYAPTPLAAPSQEPTSVNRGADSGASLLTAIREQLGLKLIAGTGPVEVLVIERVEPPTSD